MPRSLSAAAAPAIKPVAPSRRKKAVMPTERALRIGVSARLLHQAPQELGFRNKVLQGGADVAPQSYGQKPREQRWQGDVVRDRCELALQRTSLAQKKPVLDVCRGADAAGGWSRA